MYEIKYDGRAADGVKNIPQNLKEKLADAIKDRLMVDPNQYGKPLHGVLCGYRRLRVRDYRIIYRVMEADKIVRILEISNRNDVRHYD